VADYDRAAGLMTFRQRCLIATRDPPGGTGCR
jgi:hypothetical protein